MKKIISSDSPQASQLGPFLNQLLQSYHLRSYLSSDPLKWAHEFKDPWDQEVVAVISALVAYGNVKQINKSVQGILNRIESMGQTPRSFVQALQSKAFVVQANSKFSSFIHRFNTGKDILDLLKLIQLSWEKHGSLGAHFLSYLDPNDSDVTEALICFLREWKTWLPSPPRRGLLFLLSSPANQSCCKRWCMFLRWMGRKDDLDLGLWSEFSEKKRSKSLILYQNSFPKNRFLKPSQLIMPLDTHTGRISQYLRLTPSKTLNWKAAQEVTQSLKEIYPQDPTRYDFAISRLGILDICQKTYRKEVCASCELKTVCRLGREKNG